ncbi:MAG TPA: tripartite tricarboxylate transporter TctB family protein [Acidobacteriota bacterium]|nr:tripartite tricarboxylate transporter TctB family protein [Acidobacteriota bacterium]
MTDRVAGSLLVALGAAIGAESLTFTVAFPTDPVGPRGLPLLCAIVLVVGGLALIARPSLVPAWPSHDRLIRAAAGGSIFALYGLLLDPLGFAITTSLSVTALGMLFRGSFSKTLVSGILVTAGLWYLFQYMLGIPLPVGLFR